ncbi:ribonuclease HII [Kineococcus rhizosphaerae]|uniref:Ribonuclease HII n=1 Tax=Kineococcus rhizosphaerae TaxID=559628 RepID=A0A2T0RBT2_9ACTN|nr:ribonuclease HII [Kineococcus rhizosphaerae]PRY18600.1 RNase HII [Kineococcus rhizosphaerae]
MSVRPTRTSSSAPAPSLRLERQLLRSGHTLVAGVDEVGRGALAGPVSVGVLVVDATTRTAPPGLRDSKLLTPAAREVLAPKVRRWAVAWAVGHAEPAEIDAVGIVAALRLAGRRALAELPLAPDVVILDGNHDYLSDPREPSLLDDLDGAPGHPAWGAPVVTTRVKADVTCAAVAGASVLAKTTRDAEMARRHEQFPHYGWAGNKGYSAPDHLEALSVHGSCEQHRRSWRLPGLVVPTPRAEGAPAPQDALADLVLDGVASLPDVRKA